MGAKLAVTTIVTDHAGEGFKILGPNDEVPDWAVEQIGDHCWEGGKAPGKKSAKAKPDSGSGGDDEFDPSNHTVAEVQKYLKDAPDDEAERVLAAEKAGQNRKGVVGDDE